VSDTSKMTEFDWLQELKRSRDFADHQGQIITDLRDRFAAVTAERDAARALLRRALVCLDEEDNCYCETASGFKCEPCRTRNALDAALAAPAGEVGT
jgi:phosphoglycerate-specific signal transduction histidine kinase